MQLASGAVSPALPAARAMSTLWPRRSNGLYPRIRSGYSPRSGRPRAASGNTWKQRHAAAFYKREAADTKTTDPDDRPAPGGCAERGGRLCAGRTACLRNGTVAPVPACFLTGDSHEERSSEGTLTEEHTHYWGVRPAPRTRTSRIPRVMRGRRTNQLARRSTPAETRPKRRRGRLDGKLTHIALCMLVAAVVTIGLAIAGALTGARSPVPQLASQK